MLAGLFTGNFEQYKNKVAKETLAAAPKAI